MFMATWYLIGYEFDIFFDILPLMRKITRILVSLRLAYASNRAFLTGIARYRRRHPDWRVTVSEGFSDLTPEDLPALKLFDGVIIAQPQSAAARRTLERCPTPVAILGQETETLSARKASTVLVRGAAEDIGVLSARHFISLGGFNSYAFVGTNTRGSWSEARAKGFQAELGQCGITPEIIVTGHPDGSKHDLQELTRRLDALAKPTAIFAAYDNRALQVFEACEAAGITIPGDASVIGVDNDTTLCDFANPSLTSIALDQAKMGETAAEWLDRIMRRGERNVHVVTITDARVVERESTAPVIPAKHLVDRALRYIAENACSGIGVPDVIAHLGVSRALADRRFKSFTGSTLNAEINHVRVESVKRLLENTDLAIFRVTEQCGFPAPQYAKRLFLKLTGMTMKDWRARGIRS